MNPQLDEKYQKYKKIVRELVIKDGDSDRRIIGSCICPPMKQTKEKYDYGYYYNALLMQAPLLHTSRISADEIDALCSAWADYNVYRLYLKKKLFPES